MHLKWILMLAFVALIAMPVLAQDTPPIPDDIDTSTITDDQVNAIAKQLYCPVCENIPLDTCGTAACEDWRNEIRGMLATGMTEEVIIDNFVVRFGDRVVGTPRDPILAAISIITPWIVAIVALVLGGYTVLQWRQKSADESKANDSSAIVEADNKREMLREQLEKDLAG